MTGTFSRNIGKLFSKLKVVTDNLLFIYAAANWKATENTYFCLCSLSTCVYNPHTDIVVLYYLQLLKVLSLVLRLRPVFHHLQLGNPGKEARKYVWLTVYSDGEGIARCNLERICTSDRCHWYLPLSDVCVCSSLCWCSLCILGCVNMSSNLTYCQSIPQCKPSAMSWTRLAVQYHTNPPPHTYSMLQLSDTLCAFSHNLFSDCWSLPIITVTLWRFLSLNRIS